MWIQEQYKRKKSFSRKGIISKIDLAISDKIDMAKADIKINAKKGTMQIVDGKSAVIISDEVGFYGSLNYDILFIDNAFVIVLKKGTVYLKDKNNKVLSLNAKNKLEEYTGELKSICWKNRKDLLEYCQTVIKGFYNIDGLFLTNEYVNNMIISIVSSFYPHDNRLFSFKVSNHDYSPAWGKFNFEKKEKVAYVDKGYVDYESDLLKENKKHKKNEDYSDSYNEDDDMPDYEEEESNLHEIDVYEEYASDDLEDY